MILLSYIRRLAQQPGVFWLVPDSEAAVGALRTYQKGGHCGDGTHHLYATVLGGRRLSPASAINVVTTPSHWVTDLNVRVDATREPPEVDLTWLLHRPFSFLPPVAYRDQCQLSPTALSDWLQDRASMPARAGYEARWGANYTSGSELPLDWFDSDEQRHITAHRMDNIPTMIVPAHRSTHRNTVPDTTCLHYGAQPGTAPTFGPARPSPMSGGRLPAARGVARPEGGEMGRVGVPPAVGAGCHETVGGGLAYALHATSPHGVLGAPHAGDRVHT